MSSTQLIVIPSVIRQRRWWIVLLLGWTLVMGAVFYEHTRNIREQGIHVALEGARNVFHMVEITRSWNSSHGGVYVPVTPEIQPNPYLEDPARDVVTTTGVALTKINPAYMTRLIGNLANAQNGTVFHMTSLRPIRPGNAPDGWERTSLESFERGQKEVVTLEAGEHGEHLRYMAPLFVQRSCLACHAKQGYKEGDVRGGISVSVPFAPIEQATQFHVREDAIVYMLVFSMVAGMGWTALELLRRRWLELLRGVQQLTESQRQLMHAEKVASVAQLAAGMAHEINNPVGFVTSNLGTLKNYTNTLLHLLETSRAGQLTPADFAAADFDFMKEDLGDLFRESQEGLTRVTALVARLMRFSNVDKEATRLADLNAILEDTLGMVRSRIHDKTEVVCEFGQPPPVPCMVAHINQVVMALLLNAVQAIEGQGRITVRSGHDTTHAWFEVSDSGCGMDPELIERIFAPFFTTRAVGQGTGLGLTVAKDIVQAHGGRIEVQSTLGLGSTLRVYLPLRSADDASRPN
jgi:two-component system NtrC family sensor kinase